MSAIYSTQVRNEVFVTCIEPPTVGMVTSPVVSGHLIVPVNSQLNASNVVTVAGTLVIGSSSVLSVPCSTSTTTLNATWVVGSFSGVTASDCPPGCAGIVTSSSSSNTGLSVTLSVTCQSQYSLSTGAIVGIAVGETSFCFCVIFVIELMKRCNGWCGGLDCRHYRDSPLGPECKGEERF